MFIFPILLYLLISLSLFISLSLATEIHTGCAGYSLSFDGKRSYVQITVPSCKSRNPYTISTLTYEMWFSLTDWKNTYQMLFGPGGEHGVKLLRDASNRVITVKNINGAGECFQISQLKCTDLPVKAWYHIALAYNGTHYFLYCNGELLETNVKNCTGMGPGKFNDRFDI